MCAPVIVKKLNDITINDGEQLELSVEIKGDPEPQVTWSKNGKVIYFFGFFLGREGEKKLSEGIN